MATYSLLTSFNSTDNLISNNHGITTSSNLNIGYYSSNTAFIYGGVLLQPGTYIFVATSFQANWYGFRFAITSTPMEPNVEPIPATNPAAPNVNNQTIVTITEPSYLYASSDGNALHRVMIDIYQQQPDTSIGAVLVDTISQMVSEPNAFTQTTGSTVPLFNDAGGNQRIYENTKLLQPGVYGVLFSNAQITGNIVDKRYGFRGSKSDTVFQNINTPYANTTNIFTLTEPGFISCSGLISFFENTTVEIYRLDGDESLVGYPVEIIKKMITEGHFIFPSNAAGGAFLKQYLNRVADQFH